MTAAKDARPKKDIVEEIQEDLRQIDVYRDTPIRLLGYANEVGEAFRSLVPVSLVRLSYVVSIGYVCADTLDKSRKAYKLPWSSPEERRNQVSLTAADTLLWQGFASVIVPGFTINRLCALSAFALKRATALPPSMRKIATTAIGLGAIPFIVKPIDSAVEITMDQTARKLYSLKIHED
ncbi:hypothetical protein L596_019268 [Steinernema carpocapsae]|uniref:Mitochondrial fission process protein 1 n=1 Tax=Steinernema carpocapsae TaxID=34508 RepID=A0A4U5MPX4_STECR|nr:hypothetical protein L596_019268 [Steinernema carpocapsae]